MPLNFVYFQKPLSENGSTTEELISGLEENNIGHYQNLWESLERSDRFENRPYCQISAVFNTDVVTIEEVRNFATKHGYVIRDIIGNIL